MAPNTNSEISDQILSSVDINFQFITSIYYSTVTMALPYDLFVDILGRLDFQDLLVVSATSRTLQFISESILYRDVTLGGAPKGGLLFVLGAEDTNPPASDVQRNFSRMRSIMRWEPRGQHVHTLTIDTSVWFKNPHVLLPSFFRQIERAIKLMPNVKSLCVTDLPGTPCRLISLCGSLTKVEDFTSNIPADSLLAAWLENNKNITTLTLPSHLEFLGEHGLGPFNLSADALPKLLFVLSTPANIPLLVPGRPVYIVAVTDLSAAPHILDSNLHPKAFEAMKLSTVPMELIHIQIFGELSLAGLLRCQSVHLDVRFIGLAAFLDTIPEVRNT
jgi:hypothetical protein